MNRFLTVLAMMALLFTGAELLAQGGGGGGGGGAGRGPGGGGATRGPATGGERRGEAGQGGHDVGWGENGTEERILPGQVTEDKAKDEWLEKEADKLELKDKKVRATFKKLGKEAWNKSEQEDKRWSVEFKQVKSNEKQREAAIKKHQEKLAAIWNKIDEEMTKKEVLDEEKLTTWKEDTADMRKETATDKSARQDDIRARKEKEIRERMEGENKPKKDEKEKKGEEDK